MIRLRLPPTAALRGALWITLIALTAASLALTVQYLQTVRLLDARVQASVDDEAAGLVDLYRSGGPRSVAQAVARAVERPRLTEFIYLMTRSDGTVVVGNLANWPADIDRAGYRAFDTKVTSARGAVVERRVAARAVFLGDYRLLVGSLSDDRRLIHDRYIAALVWSLLTTGLIGLLLGFWYSRRGLAFLEATVATGNRFRAGRLDERLPVTGRGDEYDRVAETVNHAFAEVERLVESLRTATDALAHDLKTPLTRMRSRLELAGLEKDGVGDDGAVADVDALLRTIDDTLRLAQAEATLTSQFAPVDLQAIVREAVELFAPVAEDRSLSLISHAEPTTVSGSRSLLAQMVANLLDNAVKYTPAGGEVVVSLSSRHGAAQLIVADTGPGIALEDRDRALGRFVRLDASRHTDGAGLGLSIVAVAARLHSATLSLTDNAPGLMATVAFRHS